MNFLLINPPVRTWAKPNMVPLGLAYLATALIRNGHSVKVWDANMDSRDCQTQDQITAELFRLWDKSPWDAMGVGGIVTTFRWVESLLRANRNGPWNESPCFVGGPLAQTAGECFTGAKLGEENKAIFRWLIHGEAETCIPILEQAVRLGIWSGEFKGERPAYDLALLDFPARHLFNMAEYLTAPIGYNNKSKWKDGAAKKGDEIVNTNLQASRGCPYTCHYCRHDFMGHKWRCRPAWHVVAEMLDLDARYGCSYLHFIDDEFMAKRQFVFDFCDYYSAWGLPVWWGCTGRVNLVDEDIIKQMAFNGCKHISFGIESGSQKMLDAMNKHVKVQQALDAIAIAKNWIEDVNTTYMIGYPGETEQTLEETAEFIRKAGVKPDAVFFATPYPGTKLYDQAVADGKITDKRNYVLSLDEQGRKIACNMSNLSEDRLIEWQKILSELS